MTDIKDLELRIKSAESTLEMLRGELEELRQQQQQEPESLFGRWAEHPELGRGFLISDRPDSGGDVRFACRKDGFTDGTGWIYVLLANLTLDPVTLNTTEEFENAPEGTIVETGDMRICHKVKKNAWLRNGSETAYTHLGMTSLAECIPSRVIRWGDGK